MSWVYTFLGLVALIVLHEAGHFVAAKAVGMRVERFSLFFGPLLVRWRRGETEYGIGPIPLGGYVKIFGMTPYELEPGGGGGALRTELGLRRSEGTADASATATPSHADPLPPEVIARAFINQPVWKRVVVIGAGPLVNVVVAFLILWVVFMTSAQVTVKGPTGQPLNQVAAVQPHTPAATILRPGDRLLKADGKTVTITDLSHIVASHRCATVTPGCKATTPLVLLIQRGSRRLTVSAYPRYDAQAKVMRLGFSYGYAEKKAGTLQAAGLAVTQIGSVTGRTVSAFAKLAVSSKARRQVNSVVGATDVVSQAFSYDVAEAFFLLAVISLSLGIINLFPFLPLDGGHIFWALAEKVLGRRIPFSVLERASAVGFALVIVLFLIGFTNDVHTFSNGGFHVK